MRAFPGTSDTMSDLQSCNPEPLPQSKCSPEIQEGVREESTADAEDAPRDDVRVQQQATTGGERQLETESTDMHDAEGSPKGVEELSRGVPSGVIFVPYESELQLPHIMRLMKADLSEPYSIYTYRYFIHNWPNLCFLAMCDDKYVGAVVCKMETYSEQSGYIAMLAVDKEYRKRKIGSTLVKMTIKQMAEEGCCEVVLETEVTNKVALSLYENLGFVRDRYLHQYYLNGVDAYRLKLWLSVP